MKWDDRPADIAQGQIAFMADEQRRASKTITLAAVQMARAKEIELRIAREDHRIVDLDEAIAVLDEIMVASRPILTALPPI